MLTVQLSRQINGSFGTFNAGAVCSLDPDTARSLVAQGAATPVGWEFKGAVSSVPSVAAKPAAVSAPPRRDAATETAAVEPATEVAVKRKGKLEV